MAPRAALLTVLAFLLLVAPAAASERSEARAYAEALRVDLVPPPSAVDAMAADYTFRAAYVQASCLDAMKQGIRDHEPEFDLLLVYVFYAMRSYFEAEAAWTRGIDERLAAIPTRSPVLRRGRTTRRRLAAGYDSVLRAVPADFCVAVRAWQAAGWKGTMPALEQLLAVIEADRKGRPTGMRAAVRVLARHGAGRPELRAFAGTRPEPEGLPAMDADPVIAVLGGEAPDRMAPGEGPTRRP